MKRWIGSLAIVLVVAGAEAQSHRWESLRVVKPGTTLIVETNNRYGSMGYDRCRMVGADATSLTCMEEGTQGAKLVFPAEGVEYVSRVKKPLHLWAFLGAAVAGVFLGGLLSGNPAAIEVGIVGGIVALVAAGANAQQRGLEAVWGQSPSWSEHIHLIYSKPAAPWMPGPPAAPAFAQPAEPVPAPPEEQ